MKSNFNEGDAGERVFSLDQAQPGTEVVVERIDLDHAPVGRRLVDLGLLPETRLKVVRRAPLGDPTEFALRGYRLCLRRSDAAQIWVRESPAPSQDDA